MLFMMYCTSEWIGNWTFLEEAGRHVGRDMMRSPICYSERTKIPSNSNKLLAVHTLQQLHENDSILTGEWAECVSVWPV